MQEVTLAAICARAILKSVSSLAVPESQQSSVIEEKCEEHLKGLASLPQPLFEKIHRAAIRNDYLTNATLRFFLAPLLCVRKFT